MTRKNAVLNTNLDKPAHCSNILRDGPIAVNKHIKNHYNRAQFFLTNRFGETVNQATDHIFDVSLEDFQHRVIEASQQRPVLVDLWADWCPPCIVIAPVLEAVVRDRAGGIALARLEVDEGENMKIAGRYQVRGFPTILLIDKGEEKARFSGARPRGFIEQFIDEGLA